MITIGVSGALGRMGKRIIALASQDNQFKVAKAIDYSGHSLLGSDAGDAAGIGTIGVVLESSLSEKVDVLLDFSSPEGTQKRIDECLALGTAMVIGTTGLSQEDIKQIRQASETIAVMQAPNMSVGVNVIFSIAGKIAKLLGPEYDVEIVETHHRFKKDAPSGTALRIARVIADELGVDLSSSAVYGRKGIIGERKKGQIGILARRSGDVVGLHTISYGTIGEEIEITHRATSRDTFALGALRAAKFVSGKKSGLFSMQDVIGL